jgi:hypothetical protein
MHAIDAWMQFDHFACSEPAPRAIWRHWKHTEAHMNTTLHSFSLDDVLFVVTVFAPVSALLSGALAIVVAG